MASSKLPQNGKFLFNIAAREPYHLPDEVVKLPPPPKAPNAPSPVNILTMVIPPAIMIIGSLITFFATRDTGRGMIAILPMMMMGLGYPLANLFGNKSQVKKYKKALIAREEKYHKTLKEYEDHIEDLMVDQRRIMEREFPDMRTTIDIGLSKGKNKRLWWRKPSEQDFLRLRCGTGDSDLSFTIEPTTTFADEDNLIGLSQQLAQKYLKVDEVPFLVDLKHVGSIAINAANIVLGIRLIRRLLADLIVHHSPDDVDLYIVSDQERAGETWEWLRWVPHVHALDVNYEGRNLLMDKDRINAFLDNLKRIFFERYETIRGKSSTDTSIPLPAIVVIMDDVGSIRQHPDMVRIAAEGYQCGIYVIFMSNERVPRTCRARIDIESERRISYLETIEALGTGQKKNGRPELMRGRDARCLTRALAGLEVAGAERNNSLPTTVRITDILMGDPFSMDSIIHNWQEHKRESAQVLLPVGQWVDRTGLATYEIDFRPENLGGKGAYHAMMIGTTGSGKSIFMQSMVLAAAHKYSPRQLNFMFMDFKAGAAELKKVSDLPHSVGMITDLGPALAERALQALENELSRRKLEFDAAGKITDIWDYNRRFPDRAFPQLLVVIDEFAEGINILPNLVDRLKELGRQGRAFGMYFFLANQEVNSAVEALKANVSWYVLLKVNRAEEMNLIGRNYPVPSGRGHGYIKVKSDVTTVRGAYAGLPANAGDQAENEVGEYTISEFTLDGQHRSLYRYDPKENHSGKEVFVTELDSLMTLIKAASEQLKIPRAAPIYLQPLDEFIPLSSVIQNTEIHRLFTGTEWQVSKAERNIIPAGFIDNPERCLQMPFSINFNDSGGHLWIIGAPGSGKNATILSLLTSLSYTHMPAETQFYILDFGTGALSSLTSLPHCGAVIKAHESERIDRLFRYLQDELSSRAERDWRLEGAPDIYFVINNIADFRVQYPDQADELGRFIRSGGAVGIHLILTSNRGSELPRTLSGNMPRRIVLQMAEQQEYVDVIGKKAAPLSARTEGRGYYVFEEVSECQIAFPDKNLIPNRELTILETSKKPIKKQADTQVLAKTVNQLGIKMLNIWKEDLPRQINAMKEILLIDDFTEIVKTDLTFKSSFTLPIGINYDSLAPTWLDLTEELPFWTVLGPRQSGKSNFLASLLELAYLRADSLWKVTYVSFKRNPFIEKNLKQWENDLITDQDVIVTACEEFTERVSQPSEQFSLLLLDDIGSPYASNNQTITKALDTMGDRLSRLPHGRFLVVLADLVSNLKGGAAYTSPLLKVFQQNQTGIFLSTDDNDMQYFNMRVSLQQKKSLNLMPGRGFFVRKGKFEFTQVPYVG